jgi:hypothetical protein
MRVGRPNTKSRRAKRSADGGEQGEAEKDGRQRANDRVGRAEVGARSVIVVGDLPEFGPHFHVWYWYTLVTQLDRGRQLLYLWARDNGAVG